MFIKIKKIDRLKKWSAIDEKAEFIKQVPVHHRDMFKKIVKANEKVEFVKQAPLHPREK